MVDTKMGKSTFLLKLYFSTLMVFLAVDLAWLGLVAQSFYRDQIGYIMSESVKWPAAILFYLLFIAGVLVFIILPGLKSGTLSGTLFKAAFFGLITYATYDLTNLATLKDWPVLLTVVDMVWGTVLTLVVSYAGLMIGRRIK